MRLLRHFFSKRWLSNRRFSPFVKLGKWVGRGLAKYTTANQITILGILLCIPTLIAFCNGWLVFGAVCMSLSMMTDFVDGALAHHHQGKRPPQSLEEELTLPLLRRINYRGVTHLGKALDPFADKVRTLVVLLPLGVGWVSTWLIVTIVTVAALSTVVRPLKQYYGLGDISANRFGKYKLVIEVVGSCLLVLLPVNGVTAWIINIVFVVALFYGFLSLTGSIYPVLGKLRRRLRVRGKTSNAIVIRFERRRTPQRNAPPDLDS